MKYSVLKTYQFGLLFLAFTLSVLLTFVPSEAKAEAFTIQMPKTDFCLVRGKEENKRKAQSVVLGACDDVNTLMFEFNSRKYLETNRLCLDFQEKDIMWLYSCAEHRGKQWTFKSDQLFNPYSGKCLAVDGRKPTAGMHVKLDDCKNAQDWAQAGSQTKKSTVAKLMGVAPNQLPGLGNMPFSIKREEKDATWGSVAFLGVQTPAVVTRLGKTKQASLVLLPDEMPIGRVLPSSTLEKAILSKTAITVVLNEAAQKDLAVSALPKELQPYFAAAGGKKRKVDIRPGLYLYGLMETKSSGLKDLLKTFRVRDSNLSILTQMSPRIVSAPHDSDKKVETFYKKNMRDLLKETTLVVGIPAVKVPHLDKLVSFERPQITIRGNGLPVLGGGMLVKFPGKEIPFRASAQISNDGLLQLTGVTNIGWDKAFDIPFLSLEDIGVNIAIGVGNKKLDRQMVKAEMEKKKQQIEASTGVKPAPKKEDNKKDSSAKKNEEEDDSPIVKGSIIFELFSTAKVGKESIRTSTELEIVGQSLGNFSIGLDGEVDLGKLPGFDKIPGINEFAFSNVRLANWGAHGEVTWKRPGIKGSMMLTLPTKDKDLIGGLMMMRVQGMKMGTIVPGLPSQFANMSLGESMLYFSDENHSDKSLDNLPDFGRIMMKGLQDDPDGDLPIYDGVGLLAAITEDSIPATIRDTMKKNMDAFGGVEGPLMFQGALGNLFGGKPDVTLAAKLPKIVLPKDQPLGQIVSFDKAGADFFIRLRPSVTQFDIGLGGEMQIGVPRMDNPKQVDKLDMRGELFVKVDAVAKTGGIRVSGQMKGDWGKPLGIYDSLTIRNPAISFGVDATKSVEMGIGGDTIMKVRNGRKTIETQADFIINLQWAGKVVVPKKLGVRFAMNQIDFITYTEMMDESYRGILTGPLAKGIIETVPGPQRPVALMLQDKLKNADLSIQNLLQLDKIPLPLMSFKDVELFFATPGASIPGREQTMDTIGGVIAGKLDMTVQGKHIKLGQTENRLTLKDGIKIFTEVQGQDVGPVKFSNSHIKLVASFTEMPIFEIKGKSDVFGAKSDVEFKVTPIVTSFKSKQEAGKLLNFDFYAYAGVEDFKTLDDLLKADFMVDSKLKSDPQGFIRDTAYKEAKKLFGGLGQFSKDALAELDAAKRKVNELTNVVNEQRAEVRRNRQTVTNLIKSAQDKVSSINGEISDTKRRISELERELARCNYGGFFGPARTAVCLAGKAREIADLTYNGSKLGGLYVALGTASETLKIAKSGMDLIPIDADPRVSGPLAARDVAQLTLDAVKLSMQGVDAINKITEKVLDDVTSVEVFKLNNGALKGSLREAVTGGPVLVDLNFETFGKTVNERIAFMPFDTSGYNLRQMSSLINGIIVHGVLSEVKKIPIVPQGAIRAIEEAYALQRAEALEELEKVLVANNKSLKSHSDHAKLDKPGGVVLSDTVQNESSTLSAKAKAEAEAAQGRILAQIKERQQVTGSKLKAFANSQDQITIRTRDATNNKVLCLDSTGEQNSRGAWRVIFNQCDVAKSSQYFIHADNGEIRDINGQCLDYQEDSEIWMYECTGHPGMKWEVQNHGERLYNPHIKKCLRGAAQPQIKRGSPAVISHCKSDYENAYAFGRNFQELIVRSEGGKCLTRHRTTNHRGAILMVFRDCVDAYDQRFFINKDGLVRDLGNTCLDNQEEGIVYGYNCYNSGTGRWKVLNGHIRPAANTSQCIRERGDKNGSAILDVCQSRSARAKMFEFK